MKNAQNDMGSPKNAFINFRPKLPLPRWGGGGGGGSKNEKCSGGRGAQVGGGGGGGGGGPKMKNAQNDMGSPKNAFINFRPKLPLPRGGGGGGSKNEKCSE